jgi:hypothetical protein
MGSSSTSTFRDRKRAGVNMTARRSHGELVIHARICVCT